MIKRYYVLFFCALAVLGHSQEDFNMELVANVVLPERGNDVWGYVDGDGTEYAIMGSANNTWIWSLEDPANPIERARIPGDNSTWRDIKSWEDHLYVTTDTGDDGLLVIDMSMAPDSIRSHYITPQVTNATVDEVLGRCHNLYIDENGFCYLAGCRITGANKAIIFDLNQDKWEPPIVGIHGGNGQEYAHDLYVKNNIMYSSEINAGLLSIFDVSRKDSIIKLGDARTSFSFTHNAWSSTDQNYVFTTDERPNAYVDAYDVSDPGNITRLDRFRPLETENRGVIPHNTHYYNGYLVTSYYTDGVVITDAANPSNLIKVGSYDTFIGSDGGFRGCWGAYPYLPSGLVLASDINSGLYILQPNYQRAAYLEGTVTDAVDGFQINAVDVSIEADQMNEGTTNAAGVYKTGLAAAGTYNVTFYHPDYEPLTREVEIINGEITILDVALIPLKKSTYVGQVVDRSTGLPIPNATIQLTADVRAFEEQSDNTGSFNFTNVDDNYNVVVGIWGYQTAEFTISFGDETNDLVFELEKGYRDEFALDLGWQEFSTAPRGSWIRDTPIGTTTNDGNPVAPGADDPDDIGTQCYVTGNGGGGIGNDDVDEGEVVLVSPSFNVSDMIDPLLQYKYWFVNIPGDGPVNDTLYVNVCDDLECVTVAEYFGNTPEWSELISISLNQFVDVTKDLRVEFITSDIATPESEGHILEVAIDVVSIVEGDMSTDTEELVVDTSIEAYPNPFEDVISIESPSRKLRSFELYDVLGKQVKSGELNVKSSQINLNVAPGIYTLKLNDVDDQLVIKKIVKK